MERAHLPAPPELDRLLDAALAEDLGPVGDLTTHTLIPAGLRAEGRLFAKSPGVLAGLELFRRAFARLAADVELEAYLEDGARLDKESVVCVIEGPAHALLSAERTALNFVQRLSGIATLTDRFVRASGGVRVLDTRKTTPLLRALEKYAVVCGGGENHRLGLFDEAMIKDNHLELSGGDAGALVRQLRAAHGVGFFVTAEARDEAEAIGAIEAGCDCVLLDNFTPGELVELVPRLRAAAGSRRRPLQLEASGGVTLDTVAAFAAAGVDRVSIGALTHSAPALDLSFELRRAGEGTSS